MSEIKYSPELKDKILMVRNYMEHTHPPIYYDYLDWRWQINVWYKLFRDERVRCSQVFDLGYYEAINNNNPVAGFEIICQIIEQINKQP